MIGGPLFRERGAWGSVSWFHKSPVPTSESAASRTLDGLRAVMQQLNSTILEQLVDVLVIGAAIVDSGPRPAVVITKHSESRRGGRQALQHPRVVLRNEILPARDEVARNVQMRSGFSANPDIDRMLDHGQPHKERNVQVGQRAQDANWRAQSRKAARCDATRRASAAR